MKKQAEEKNVLMADVMSAEQLSPGLARPEDFQVNEELPFHGQCGSSAKEYKSLLSHSGDSTKARLTGKGVSADRPSRS
ncbi:MAG TPA: hypothetical protein VFA74_09210 [Terriglobales bacterium]|nr:hypothetical protein [Terriglobales bacterium]